MIIDGVFVKYPPEMPSEEAAHYAREDIENWYRDHPLKGIAYAEINLDSVDVIIQIHEKSPIRRVRRITGYLSEVGNFNDAKRAELYDRTIHELRRL